MNLDALFNLLVQMGVLPSPTAKQGPPTPLGPVAQNLPGVPPTHPLLQGSSLAQAKADAILNGQAPLDQHLLQQMLAERLRNRALRGAQ